MATPEGIGKKLIRKNVIYRSLRKSTSSVAYSLKKKVSGVQKTLGEQRRALQTLQESPSPQKCRVYHNLNLSVTPLTSTPHAFCTASPNFPQSSAKKGDSADRLAKQIARCRIYQIQSPKFKAKRSKHKDLQAEVNALAQGLQDLHNVAHNLRNNTAKV